MELKLRCHRVVILGGGTGIGKAIAHRMLIEGASVVICGRRREKLESARAELAAEFSPERIAILEWDIARVDDFAEKIAQAESLLGASDGEARFIDGEPRFIDGFVNAAGIGTGAYTGRGYEPWDITSDEWDAINDVNYKGMYFLMRNEIDYMKSNGIRGNILNIASNAGTMGIVGSYGAAKSAIIKWTHSLGLRYGGDGIMLHCISPGATLTDMISRYAKSADQPYDRHAIGRFILPEETARLAAVLMSELGVIMTSHNFIADGGDKNSFE